MEVYARRVGLACRGTTILDDPHPLLGGRVPREVAIATKVGAVTVEQILGRLTYGTAV